jgi:hypothetical protein
MRHVDHFVFVRRMFVALVVTTAKTPGTSETSGQIDIFG